MDYQRELIKAEIDSLFTQICKTLSVDRVTLFMLVDELAEEEGFIDANRQAYRLYGRASRQHLRGALV